MSSPERIFKKELCDDGLLSLEKLDRASPEMWPEKIPGITDFIAMSDTPICTPAPEWTNGLSREDVTSMLELSKLSHNGVILEVKNIYDDAYQLGVHEAKEMTRGKYLGIFSNAKKK
ncbi:protein lin-52 homolog isoform X2 [Teleopsis dalmanni]|uniref:protein lin-52 homolog isoform X2 n=1 Tax=Teleopsis dalmanni TaxID=139649 RepID=UPI0018CCEB51|nr:protein lin-52 homolog isoform X2 [Teleopsis dalmanni]